MTLRVSIKCVKCRNQLLLMLWQKYTKLDGPNTKQTPILHFLQSFLSWFFVSGVLKLYLEILKDFPTVSQQCPKLLHPVQHNSRNNATIIILRHTPTFPDVIVHTQQKHETLVLTNTLSGLHTPIKYVNFLLQNPFLTTNTYTTYKQYCVLGLKYACAIAPPSHIRWCAPR